jgi:predicted branched-subunit amino acid permease
MAPQPPLSRRSSFLRGIRDSVPIFVAVGAFGIVFGVVGSQLGGPPWLPLAMSVIVISGAAQFAMVALWGAGLVPILVAVIGLSLRHLPMGARFSEALGPRPLATRLGLSYVLTDETFGLALAAAGDPHTDPVAYKVAADLNLWVSWVGGTILGAWAGASVDPASIGADVLFAVLFLSLAVPFIRSREDFGISAIAAACALIAIPLLPEAWEITGAAFAAAAIGTVRRG